MSSDVTQYKCPSCGGALQYSTDTGRVKCRFCGNSYEIEEIEAMNTAEEVDRLCDEIDAETAAFGSAAAQAAAGAQTDEDKTTGAWTAGDQTAGARTAAGPQAAAQEAKSKWDTSGAGTRWGSDADGMREYRCPTCGATVFCDATTAATKCPYCGSPGVIGEQFGGTIRPDYVIPFKISKQEAIEALKAHYKGKVLVPRMFLAERYLEKIEGVYVPFWLFDADADADLTFDATNSYSYREGDYDVTETKHYKVRRAGDISFRMIPADGSSKMPDDYMDSLEPFDYKELKPFSTAYLPGFLADRYDIDADGVSGRIDTRCEHSAEDVMRQSVTGFDTVTTSGKQIRLKRGEVKYALLPVWLLSAHWEGETYLFAMNGQTGKVVGNLPMDKKKSWAWFGGVAAGLWLILSILFTGPLSDLLYDLFY